MERTYPRWIQILARPPGRLFHALLSAWTLVLLWRAELFCLGLVLFGFTWSVRIVLWVELERPGLRRLWPWAGLPVLLALQTTLVVSGVPQRLEFARIRPELEQRVLAAQERLDAGARILQEDGPLSGYELHAFEGGYAFERVEGDPTSDWSHQGFLWARSGSAPTPVRGVTLVPMGASWFRWSAYKTMAFERAP